MNNTNIIYKFIYKYIYILKAASNGWIIKTLGNNTYEFYRLNKKGVKL
jgi:hypothetical protein